MTPRLALLLWSGNLGGAETFTASLAAGLRRLGADARVLFVTRSGPLAERLTEAGTPHSELGLARGAAVLPRARLLARAAEAAGADGVLAPSAGYLPGALRAGGYRGSIVAVNHGRILRIDGLPLAPRLVRRADRLSGFWAADAEVAVSDFVLRRLERERLRARSLVRIHNGVELARFRNGHGPSERPFTAAWAGRFVPGKGVEGLLYAFARARRNGERLRLAGDGPERPRAERLAADLGLNGSVDFPGWLDPAACWADADLAVAPAREVESFGMAAVEAMASGLPVLASATGGLPELVGDGVTGRLVPPGDVETLAAGLRAYAADERLRREHGAAGRARCEARFSIDVCARRYLALFEEAART